MRSFSGFTLIAVGLLEYAGLRYLQGTALDISIGWGQFGTDFEVLLPVLIPLALLLMLWSQQIPLPGPSKTRLIRHSVVLVSLVGYSIYLSLYDQSPANSARVLWKCIAVCNFLTLFFVFVPLSYIRRHPQRSLAGVSILMALSPFTVRFVSEDTWFGFRELTSRSVALVCGSLLPEMTTRIDLFGNMRLIHPTFVGAIAKECAGVEALILWSWSSLLIIMLYQPHWKKSVLFIGGGYVVAFALNVLRISFIYLGSVAIGSYFSEESAQRFFFRGFHTHLGWVLYALGFFAFFSAFRHWLITEKVDDTNLLSEPT